MLITRGSIVLMLSSVLYGSKAQRSEGKHLLLIGVTGSGKSTLGNTLLASSGAFEVGNTLDSCTSFPSNVEGILFGESDLPVSVSDSGGLGDSMGRDEEFTETIAKHVRSYGGVDGIVYVHNACNTRLDAQSRHSLGAMLATLSNNETRPDFTRRVSVVMTQCTSLDRRVLYTPLAAKMCADFDICNIPIFWYDDHGQDDPSLLGSVVQPMRWRYSFRKWVEGLPSKPFQMPGETEREELQKIHDETVAFQKREREDLVRKLEEARTGMEMLRQGSDEAAELKKEIQQLNDHLLRLDSKSCLAGDSVVVDRDRGVVLVKDLKIGNQVSSADGWTTVTSFLHWHPNQTVSALKVIHSKGLLTLSPGHLAFIVADHDENRSGRVEAIPARKLRPGMMLSTKGNKQGSRIQNIEEATMDGFYAPITAAGNIIVDNVVVSCYTEDTLFGFSHQSLHILAAPLRLPLPEWLSYMPCAGCVHPYVSGPHRLLQTIFAVFKLDK